MLSKDINIESNIHQLATLGRWLQLLACNTSDYSIFVSVLNLNFMQFSSLVTKGSQRQKSLDI